MTNNQYQYQTLLPIFPYLSNDDPKVMLLSANTPEHRLTHEQAEQRRLYGYHRPTMIAPIDDQQRQLFFLSRLWNIDRAILEWNLMRILRIVQSISIHRTYHFTIQTNQGYLHEDEYALALEFYLQIDQDLFYMKTCGFRGAMPIPDERSILCLNEPQVQYSFNSCHRRTCCLCYPAYRLTYRMNQPLIRFGSHQEHYFVHGYRSILNCPATCETRNIIYALTCPCGKVDYIGETSSSLPIRLSYHQQHGNRIIQEFLIGSKNTTKIRPDFKSTETLIKDSMTLYQHSARCPSALQWFLDENPDYWPFIPKKIDPHISLSSLDDSLSEENMSWSYANDVPQAPNGYHFTLQQKIDMEQFFQLKKYRSSPNVRLDLYQVALIAILPVHASDNLRHMIESLFITYARTSLNTDGHLDDLMASQTIRSNSCSVFPPLWCENLVCRSFSNSSSSSSTIAE